MKNLKENVFLFGATFVLIASVFVCVRNIKPQEDQPDPPKNWKILENSDSLEIIQ